MPHSTESVISIEPLKGSKFGAIVTGADLNNVSEEGFAILKKAVYENTLIIIKRQENLEPINQFEFVHRFDPAAARMHGHGNMETVKKTVNGKPTLLAAGSSYSIPGAEGVRLVASGYQGPDHYGLKDVNFKANTTTTGQSPPMTQEDVDAGFSRFGRWHIDCALYEREPPLITALRAIKLPQGPDLTIRWDDGTGKEMKVPPGRTAYFSGEELYEMLTDEEKLMADNSRVRYAPDPYRWISPAKLSSDGISIPLSQGKELPFDSYPWDEKLCKEYPMVWHNPVTGKKAFQVHAICALKLTIKSLPDAEEKVIDNVDEVRAFLANIHRRILNPETVLIAPYEEGDVALWNNRGCMHTFYEYPESYGSRTMHQVNIAASIPPS